VRNQHVLARHAPEAQPGIGLGARLIAKRLADFGGLIGSHDVLLRWPRLLG